MKTLIKHVAVEDVAYNMLPDDGDEPGTVRAIVSVYGNVDRVGDRVVDGAFDETILRRVASGKRMPIVYAHNYTDASAVIGYAEPWDIASLPGVGLEVKMHLNLETKDGKAAYDALKEGMLEWSFGYRVISEKKASDGANELLELDLVECGPCLVGVNPATQTISVKSNAKRRLGIRARFDQRMFERGQIELVNAKGEVTRYKDTWDFHHKARQDRSREARLLTLEIEEQLADAGGPVKAEELASPPKPYNPKTDRRRVTLDGPDADQGIRVKEQSAANRLILQRNRGMR